MREAAAGEAAEAKWARSPSSGDTDALRRGLELRGVTLVRAPREPTRRARPPEARPPAPTHAAAALRPGPPGVAARGPRGTRGAARPRP